MPDGPGTSSRDLPPFKRGQLRYFVTVADEGQVTRAAEKLHMAQPAVSQAIASLEGQLGVRLLERHGRGVTLTLAGEVFLEKARLAVDAEADVLRTADSLARGLDGTIVLGDVGMPAWMVYPVSSKGSLGHRPTPRSARDRCHSRRFLLHRGSPTSMSRSPRRCRLIRTCGCSRCWSSRASS